jgi:hypothetical protein
MTELEKQAEEAFKDIDRPTRSGKDMYSYKIGYVEGFKDANQWVDCKERLPEMPNNKESVDYLVIVEYFTRIEQMVAEWWFDGVDTWSFTTNINGSVNYKITHWLPLPSTDSINLK